MDALCIRVAQGVVSLYNRFAWFWHMVERQRERELYADLHARLYVQGFTNQISFYGTTKEPYDGKHYQARIEVVTPKELDEAFVTRLFDMLTGFKPEKEYTLFAVCGSRLLEAIPIGRA